MTVNVQFPEELLVVSREDQDVFSRNVVITTLGRLYVQGKISSGIGARVLGCDRLEFYRLLSDYGFPVVDYTKTEWDAESQSARRIAERIKNI